MSRRLVFLFALVLGLFVVEPAYASPVEGFANGLNDFVHPDSNVSSDITPERDFIESYEPQEVVLSAPVVREYDEDSTTVDYVNGTLDEFNKVPWNSSSFSWLQALRIFIGSTGSNMALSFLLPAVGLVFIWWGVRKAIRMVMAAFRKGRMTT